MESIAVISVLYKNPKEQVKKMVKSLLDNGIAKRDIFFIDNEKDNVGYGGGINKILKKQLIHYDYFFIINPDTLIHKGCIQQLLETCKLDKAIGIVGPKILDQDGRIWSAGGILDKKRYSGGLIDLGKKDKIYDRPFYDVDYVPGTAMLIKKEVFEKIGFFAEDYFLYYEDNDFNLRAKKAGFRLVANPHAVITHFASTSTGQGSSLQLYYLKRNNMLFVERYAPIWVKLREIIRFPKTLYEVRGKKYELLGIQDYLVRRFGKRDYWS